MEKIIVVDDDPTNAGLIKMLLELEGFRVDACTDIDQAKTAAAQGVSAFVVDVNLARGVSGLELLRAVRAGETSAPNDTVVVMTSGDHRRKEESHQGGANKFLLKPYPPQKLSGYLHALLSGKE